MPSSVARMPTDHWLEPGRLAAGVFSSPRLKKVLRRSNSNVCNTSSSGFSDVIAKDDSVFGETMDRSSRAYHNVAESSCIAWQRHQSQIIDRWAAGQAKEMVATIERQTHEEELSSLAYRTQPVSARDSMFLRETLPNRSIISSSGSTTSGSDGRSNAGGVVADVLPNLRASTLIQMWRELEAEAGMPFTPRTASGGGKSGANAASPFKSEESSIHSDRTEAVSCDSKCEGMTEASREQRKEGNIVRMSSSGTDSSSTSLSSSSSSEEAPFVATATKGFKLWCLVSSALAQKRQRDLRDLEILVARMEQGRRTELEALAERQNVSRFTYRGRLQSVLRLRSLRRPFSVQDQKAESTPPHMEQFSNGPQVSCISQENNCQRQYYATKHSVSESSNCFSVEVPSDSYSSGYARDTDDLVDENKRYTEDVPSDWENDPQEANSTIDDTQEGSNRIESSWDGSSSWKSSLDWQAAARFSLFSSCHREVVNEELGTYPVSDYRNSSTNDNDLSQDSRRECGTSRRQTYPNLLERLSDNVELCELQKRRTVTTSLSSDFCNKMNRIISTFLQRQNFQHVNENLAVESEHWSFRGQSNQFQDFEQPSSASSRLVPLLFYNFPNTESWQHTSFRNQFPQNSHGMEHMHELRNDMAQIRREIIELRKLLESCMSWQDKFQQSIKKEVSDAICQSGCFNAPTGLKSTRYSSNPTPGRKGSCCICCEMPVDSLLYRCGHMCACYKCATELQRRSGKCPICRSPIKDVVRAYPIQKDDDA